MVIRLGRIEQDPIQWLIWSVENQTPVKEGCLSNALQLNELTEYCQNLKVYILAPGSSVTYHTVSLPGKITRKSIQALPFLVEEFVASDIDKLHIIQLHRQQNIFYLAVVDKTLIQQWLSWLLDAGISPYQMLPDTLAIPIEDDNWQAVKLEQQWLIRQTLYSGMAVDESLLPIVLSVSTQPMTVYCYSDLPDNVTGWQIRPPVSAMILFAKNVINNKVNLLEGFYKQQTQWQQLVRPWYSVIFASVICLFLILANMLIDIYQINQQATIAKQQTVELYRQLFPNEKRVTNPRKQMEQRISQLKQQTNGNSFIHFLNEIQPILMQFAPIEMKTLHFNEKQNELRFTARINDLDHFEQLRKALTKQYQVQQIDLAEKYGKVEGSLIIRRDK